ncbi:ABC transporter substrate-binding protein, partial [Rhizobium leguminosarum]|uniref:ABC transporter substrate-binding protein n=1 Tax=Rhizobium leguminosarum TaxID=384 RepID=UPI003F9EB560
DRDAVGLLLDKRLHIESLLQHGDAKDKGFYKEEGLDVEIKQGGPDIAPEQVIAGGGADVIVEWMGGALVAREKGVPIVNIAQPYQK